MKKIYKPPNSAISNPRFNPIAATTAPAAMAKTTPTMPIIDTASPALTKPSENSAATASITGESLANCMAAARPAVNRVKTTNQSVWVRCGENTDFSGCTDMLRSIEGKFLLFIL